MTKSLFLVTSAVNARFGIYDSNQRLNQTIDSLKSIKQFCDADIILVDAGQRGLSKEYKQKLLPYLINIIEFSGNPIVQDYQKIDNWDVVKSLLEINMLKAIFENLYKEKDFTKNIKEFLN